MSHSLARITGHSMGRKRGSVAEIEWQGVRRVWQCEKEIRKRGRVEHSVGERGQEGTEKK